MSFLERLDPGDAVTEVVLVTLAQTTVVILSAALLGWTLLKRRADARHTLWLGALIWVLISPAAAVAASRLGFALWTVALPFPDPGTTSTVNEINGGTAIGGGRGSSHGIPQSDPSRLTTELTDSATPAEEKSTGERRAKPHVEWNKPKAPREALPSARP